MKYILIALALISNLNAASQIKNFRPYSSIDSNQIIEHTFYELEYSEKHEQPLWVYYVLTPEFINGVAERKNNYKIDFNVKGMSSTLSDYKGSGYDRGHLCPAGSMKISQEAMDESFFMSNMSPQKPGFNRGKWKHLESTIRSWVSLEKELHVVTGAILTDSIGFIGSNKVTVPKYFYKVIYAPSDEKKMIGFIMPNAKTNKPISSYSVTIDEVEQKTGIDFFSSLPDSIENYLEKSIGKWEFTSSNSTYKNNKAPQCKGKAQSTGKRCRKKTKNENGYCHYHQYQDIKYNTKYVPIPIIQKLNEGRCSATTKAGTRCKRSASSGGKCWQH